MRALVAIFWLIGAACQDAPDGAKLDEELERARALDREMLAEHGEEPLKRDWELVVEGRISSGSREVLDGRRLEELARDRVKTRSPFHDGGDKLQDFRGVKVSRLLEEYGVEPGVEEITFVAHDAYRTHVSLDLVRRYSVLLALERNGEPMPFTEGGPIYLVYPFTDHPELQNQPLGWAFYVTHVVVGTEAASVRVGDRVLGAEDLAALPRSTVATEAGYRVGWPSGTVHLHGPLVRDVLSEAEVVFSGDGFLQVRGKPDIYRDEEEPILVPLEKVRECDVLLATQHGLRGEPIPARLGGPVTLAFPPGCPDESWVTFVEELEVVRE